MRIVAGEHRGRRLNAPKGMGTRPTTDRVRESLMSSLNSELGGFDGCIVLDLFAGSGALALESLSRGAAFATMCDRDAGAVKVIEENAKALGYGADRVRVCRCDSVARGIPVAKEPYDLVFLDPPYAFAPSDVLALVASGLEAGSLALKALIAYEHDAGDDAAVDAAMKDCGLLLVSRRHYGDTAMDIMEFAEYRKGVDR